MHRDSCFDLIVTGQEAHAGTTPMKIRRDALLGADRIAEAVRGIGREHLPGARLTVGQLDVRPNSRNAIPARVSLSVDLRAPRGRPGCPRRGPRWRRRRRSSARWLVSASAWTRWGTSLRWVSMRAALMQYAGGRRGRVRRHGDRGRRRARCLPHRGAGADAMIIHRLRRRHQPQRAGGRHPGGLWRGRQRAAARGGRARRCIALVAGFWCVEARTSPRPSACAVAFLVDVEYESGVHAWRLRWWHQRDWLRRSATAR